MTEKKSDVESLFDQAIAYFNAKETAAALATISASIAKEPTFFDAYGLRARIHQDAGDLDKALPDYDQLIEHYPRGKSTDDPDELTRQRLMDIQLSRAYACRGSLRLIVKQDNAGAREDWNAALRLGLTDAKRLLDADPKTAAAWFWNDLAANRQHNGDSKGALAAFEEALGHSATDTAALTGKILLLNQLEQFDDALATWQAAQEAGVKDAALATTAARTYEKLGKHEEAIATCEAATQIADDYDVAWYNLACYRAVADDKDGAIAALAKAIDLNPSNRNDATGDGDFSSLFKDERFIALVRVNFEKGNG